MNFEWKKFMIINKIYVASPGEKDNGGGESLHQLVDALNRLGYDAYIYYFDSKRDTILEKMLIYNVKLSKQVEDDENNLLVCPEMFTYPLKKYKKIQKCIWFLSLDFYLRSLPIYRTKFVSRKWNIPLIFFPILLIGVLAKTEATFKSFQFRKDNVQYFLYNVEYAREYIERECKINHIEKYLCGPINEIYFKTEIERPKKEKLVVFNPKKANAFTTKVIEAIKMQNQEIEFISIQNLNQEGVKKLLGRASVYMDFGFFPGPERIPREAAIMRCNIVTSKQGSAANDIDVPISSRYKFELDVKNINSIVGLILDMVYNYENYVEEFESYRKKVFEQKRNFDMYVQDFMESIQR